MSVNTVFYPKDIPVVYKSDGGSTISYYGLPEHATELNHLMSAKGMSFARGNIFKACYRRTLRHQQDHLLRQRPT
jgi:hypothetical protein